MRKQARVNLEWSTPELNFTWQHVEVEVLQDIREELRTLNALLRCDNFLQIPNQLRAIRLNTNKPTRKRKE